MLKKWMFTAVVLLLIVFFWDKYKDNGIKLVQYQIAEVKLNIPKSYHYSTYEKFGRWPNVISGLHKTTYISLEALLPNLEAVNKKNQRLFKVLGWGRKLRISLNSYGMKSFERGINFDKKYDLLIKEPLNKYGLIHYKRKLTEKSKPHDDFFILKDDGNILLTARCDFKNPHRSPACHFDRILSNGIHLNYSYSRDYLYQWKTIDSTVLKLLASFCTQPKIAWNKTGENHDFL
jgi:hypothetical protein